MDGPHSLPYLSKQSLVSPCGVRNRETSPSEPAKRDFPLVVDAEVTAESPSDN